MVGHDGWMLDSRLLAGKMLKGNALMITARVGAATPMPTIQANRVFPSIVDACR